MSSKVLCPICGQPAFCVDSSGFGWRCYGHGELTFDVRDQSREQQAEAASESAALRSLSKANAAEIRNVDDNHKYEQAYDELANEGFTLDSHESDLYVKDSPLAREILDKHKVKYSSFIDDIDHARWLDVPFAYAPFWREKAKVG